MVGYAESVDEIGGIGTGEALETGAILIAKLAIWYGFGAGRTGLIVL